MTVTSTRSRITAAIAAITLAGLAPSDVSAGTMQTAGHDFIHRNLANQSTYDSVVSLNIIGSTGAGTQTGDTLASGVIIGGRYLLTAAHNVDFATDIFVNVRGKTVRASRWVVNVNHYNWDFSDVNRDRADSEYNPFPDMTSRGFEEGHDIALIELPTRIPRARTMRAKLSGNVNQANGKTGTIVGFGAAGDGEFGFDLASGPGVKRAGQNKIDILNSAIGGQLSVDFDVEPTDPIFNSPLNPKFNSFTGQVEGITEDDIPLSQEYMPAVGDSGGGLFVNGNTLAGITSWTSRSDSTFFSQAYFTTIAKHRRWITDNIQALKGLRVFRGNLKVWQEIPDTDPPRFNKISDFGAPGFALIPEREDRMGDGIDDAADNTFGFVFSDPLRSPGPLSYKVDGSAVPEPASLALLSLGGLAMLRRTRD